MSSKLFAGVAAAVLLGSFGLAYAEEEIAPSAEELRSLQAAVAPLGCTFEEVNKETDNRFEINDATCAAGQYDFKIDGQYRIILMDLDQ